MTKNLKKNNNFVYFLSALPSMKGRGRMVAMDIAVAFPRDEKRPPSFGKAALTKWLRTPIYKGFSNAQHPALRDKHAETVRLRKFLYLFQYLGVEYPDWEGLSRAIAAEFVPGLKIEDMEPPTAGRPKGFNKASKLCDAVDEILLGGEVKTSSDAIRQLLKADPAEWGYTKKLTNNERRSAVKSLGVLLSNERRRRKEV